MSFLMVPRAPITNGNVFVLIRPTFFQPSRFPSIMLHSFLYCVGSIFVQAEFNHKENVAMVVFSRKISK